MPAFLHAAHQVRETFDQLELVSWLAIGFAAGALVLAWGRILLWLRQPDSPVPALRRWGKDDDGWYFEVASPGEGPWTAEDAAGELHALARAGVPGFFRLAASEGAPVALRSPGGLRLPL